jgi:hypothetical protein
MANKSEELVRELAAAIKSRDEPRTEAAALAVVARLLGLFDRAVVALEKLEPVNVTYESPLSIREGK